MAFYDISYSDDSVTFVNTKTNKAEKFELFEQMADIDAIRIVNGEIKARDNVSKASVSLLSHLLDSPRLDEYKGKTPINELIPNDLKSAIRDIETCHLEASTIQVSVTHTATMGSSRLAMNVVSYVLSSHLLPHCSLLVKSPP